MNPKNGSHGLFKSLRNFFAGLKTRFFHFAAVAVKSYYEDMLSLRAMSLTYSTLLSLVPFLAVTFSVLKAFGVQNQIEPVLTQALVPLGPERVEITRRLVAFVDNIRVGVLGAVGVVGLFYTVILLVGNIEDSLNRIWEVKRSRGWAHRYREYLSVILLGPVLIFTASALIATAQSHWLVQQMLENRLLGLLFALITQVMPFLFLCAGFTFLYKFIPCTRVHLRSAIIGAAVAAVLWQAAGVGFAAFVAGSGRYAAIYSGFAILVLFLIWLYAGWLIVLLGAEIAYIHQYAYFYISESPDRMQAHSFREWLALSALVEITKRYLEGKRPWQEQELSAHLGVPVSSLEDLVNKFVGCGVLLRSAEPQGIALSQPPEQITVIKVLSALREEEAIRTLFDGEQDSALSILRRRDVAVQRGLEGVTLRSLASQPPTNVMKIPRFSAS